MKVILADFDLSKLPEVIENANKRTAENERRRFADTVANWDNKPSFTREETTDYGGIKDFEITTDSEIYKWVDEGTELHPISANGNYPLNVRGYESYRQGESSASYFPKSTNEKLLSDGPGEYAEKSAYLNTVYQKIEPRNFTQKILEKAPERWQRAIATEIKKYIGSM